MVEYILILFVILMTALFFLRLSTAFNQFAENYAQEYLACLLETGELPSMGNDISGNSICDSQFDEFSLANGRPPNYTPGPDGPVGGGGVPPGGGGAGAGGAGQGAGGSGRSPRIGTTTGGLPSQGIDGSGGAGTAQASVEDDGGGGRSQQLETSYTARRFGRSRRIASRAIAGNISEQDDGGRSSEINRSGPAGRTTVQQGGEARGTRIAINPTPTPTPPPDEGEGFSFGNLLKYLLIGAIIIALVVFLGGQAAQVARGWDSGK